MAYQLTSQDKTQAQQIALQMAQAKPAKQKSSGNFLTSLLPTAGGILGGIGGSFFGPGVGTAVGGAAGAGAGKFLQNILEGKSDAGEGVLGEAALGTLGGVGKGLSAIKGAAGAVKAGQGLKSAGDILRYGTKVTPVLSTQASTGLLSRTGKGLENLSGKMLGSQSQITAAQARQAGINPVKALSSVNKRTGLTNLNDMAEVSRGLTGGKDSMLDMLTREAVGSTNGVKLPDLHKTAKDLLDNVGSVIPESQRKQLLNNIVNAESSMRGGASGTLSTLANPQSALDIANTFRGTAKELTNSFTSTPAQKQLAKVYVSLAGNIEQNLYKSPGVSESIPTLVKAGADDLLFKAQDLKAIGNTAQAKAYEKVAVDLRNVKDIAGLRKFKKDFVDIGKIDTATAQAEGTRTLAGGSVAGKAGSILRNPMNIVAAPLDVATPAIAGATARAGRALQGGMSVPQMSTGAKISGTQLTGRALTGTLPGQGAEPSITMPTQSAMMETGTGTTDLTGTDVNQPIYTKEAVASDIQKDLVSTGGANMDKYITLYNFLNPEIKDTKQKQASVKEYSQANTALSGVDQLSKMISENPSLAYTSQLSNVPLVGGLLSGATGSSEYNATANNILNSIARLNTGANMPASEESMYRKTYLPQPGDNPETVQQKMATLQQFFEPFTQGY